MKTERRKSIIILAITLTLGVLLGLLAAGVMRHYQMKQVHVGREQMHEFGHKRKSFVGSINSILKPDEAQAEMIRPIIESAALRIDSLENAANQEMNILFDSLRNQLMPVISKEQLERLDQFNTRVKGNWKRGDRHRRRQ